MNRMVFEHFNDCNPIACFLDENRTQIVKRFWSLEIKALFNLVKKIGKVKVVNICVKLKSSKVLRLEGLRGLEISFAMNALIQDYLEMGLKSLHQEWHIGSCYICL